MAALADFVTSVTDVAVSVTLRLLTGVAAGAEYVVAAPLAVIVGYTVPHGGPEHETVQVTPLPAESLFTVAVNLSVAPADTVIELGEIETVIVGGNVLEPLPPQPKFAVAIPAVKIAKSNTARFGDISPSRSAC